MIVMGVCAFSALIVFISFCLEIWYATGYGTAGKNKPIKGVTTKAYVQSYAAAAVMFPSIGCNYSNTCKFFSFFTVFLPFSTSLTVLQVVFLLFSIRKQRIIVIQYDKASTLHCYM